MMHPSLATLVSVRSWLRLAACLPVLALVLEQPPSAPARAPSPTFERVTAPTFASCALAANSTDFAGRLSNIGDSGGTCVLMFAAEFWRAPSCLVTSESDRPTFYTASASFLSVATEAGVAYDYVCSPDIAPLGIGHQISAPRIIGHQFDADTIQRWTATNSLGLSSVTTESTVPPVILPAPLTDDGTGWRYTPTTIWLGGGGAR